MDPGPLSHGCVLCSYCCVLARLTTSRNCWCTDPGPQLRECVVIVVAVVCLTTSQNRWFVDLGPLARGCVVIVCYLCAAENKPKSLVYAPIWQWHQHGCVVVVVFVRLTTSWNCWRDEPVRKGVGGGDVEFVMTHILHRLCNGKILYVDSNSHFGWGLGLL